MTSIHKTTSGKSSVSSSPAASGKLVVGARGASVSELQQLLKSAGFDPGPVDSKFGPKTEAAVKAYQRSHGLTPDGWAGPKTLASLHGAVAGTSGDSSFTPAPPSAPPATTAVSTGPRADQVNSLLDWAKGKIGAPYAAVNPFRFGEVPWDGKPHPSFNSGRIMNFPKGTQVFDCSGFVVTAYKQLGVDLAKEGLTSSSAIKANSKGFLQDINPDQLQPGDLITYQPENGVGHVVIYAGNGQIIQASPPKVNLAPLDTSRIQCCRRVPLPGT